MDEGLKNLVISFPKVAKAQMELASPWGSNLE